MKTLHLNIKRKWFDMIKSCEKLEEYRELKDYWFNRFKNDNCRAYFRSMLSVFYTTYKNNSEDETSFNIFKESFELMEIEFDTITFSNGYAKDRDQFIVKFEGIEIKEGKAEWGAEPGKKYFVLKLGKTIT